MTDDKKWPRDMWLEAIWEDPDLKPNERVVAYVYARYAGKSDIAWTSWPEIMRRTGMRSRRSVSAALQALGKSGWLVQVQRPRQHRSAVYRLTCPLQQSQSATAEPVSSSSESLPLSDPAVAIRHPAVANTSSSGSRSAPPVLVVENSEKRSDVARDPARGPTGAQDAANCTRCHGRRIIVVAPGCVERCPNCAPENEF